MSRGFKPPAFVFERIRAYQSDKLRIHYSTRFESAVMQAQAKPAAPKQAPGEPRARTLGLLKQTAASLRHVRAEVEIIRREKPDAVMARPDLAFSFCLSTRWTGVPLVLSSPLLALQFDLSPEAIGVLLLALLLGTPLLSMIGAIGAALTVGLRGGGALVALLVLPLYVPVLIFGAGAVEATTAGLGAQAHLSVMGALLILSAVFTPWVIAAALRISLE